ncbi:hypothetical protein [Natrialbaceae archaeon AArc-T1-2]|uniref:hypothetical protein n=1 Tax=Natrialbaceae archaeon AArc-T1-2 TaxID=3053904 RepID=UPI00255AB6A4|nr:hypothetical protein [Natrialbaceae archaeon AArc-T1-2]WIV67658.1 hypothetical protein QQ977_02695 [Natrialbaceae archaeon AArc-T1-2]
MDAPVEQRTETDTERDAPSSIVTSHEPRPGKVVFVERNNADGWIATDVAVDLER